MTHEGLRRLEAIRSSRLAIDPAEERALLSEAQAVAAARAAPPADPDPAPRAKPSGRGRSGQGRGRARGGRAAARGAPAAREVGKEGGQEGGQGVGRGGGGAGKVFQRPLGPLAEGVRFCALDVHEEAALWDVAPAFVVIYDPDIALVRQLEARRPAALGQGA